MILRKTNDDRKSKGGIAVRFWVAIGRGFADARCRGRQKFGFSPHAKPRTLLLDIWVGW